MTSSENIHSSCQNSITDNCRCTLGHRIQSSTVHVLHFVCRIFQYYTVSIHQYLHFYQVSNRYNYFNMTLILFAILESFIMQTNVSVQVTDPPQTSVKCALISLASKLFKFHRCHFTDLKQIRYFGNKGLSHQMKRFQPTSCKGKQNTQTTDISKHELNKAQHSEKRSRIFLDKMYYHIGGYKYI